MKQHEMPEWIPRATFTVIGCILLVIAGFWVTQKLQDLIAWIIISLFLSFAIEPLTNKLERRGWKRTSATGFVLAITLVTFAVFIASMVPLIISQLVDLVKDAPRLIGQLSDFIHDQFGIIISTDELVKRLTDFGATFGQNGSEVASNVVGVGGRLVSGLFQIFTVAVFTYYLVVEGPEVRRKIMKLMPAKQQKIFIETWEIAIEKMGGYLYVRLVLALFSAVTAFVVMYLAKVPFALPLAIWIGLVSQFIPVVGTYIAAAVPIFVALLDRPWSALILAIYVVLYQQVENYYISPKLTAKTMQLHPAIAIGAAIAGASLYGPVGAFLALPAAAIIQVVVGSYLWQHEVIESDAGLLSIGGKTKTKA